jgi:O-antigen ligase
LASRSLLGLLVYSVPYTLLWVSADLPFPYVTSKTILVTLVILIAAIVLIVSRAAITITRFDILFLLCIGCGWLTGVANGNPGLSFYSTLERCNGVALQLVLLLYLVVLRSSNIDWRMYWGTMVSLSVILVVHLVIQNGLVRELTETSLLGNKAYLAGFLVLCALVSLWLARSVKVVALQWFLYAVAATQIFVALLTNNRSAMVGCVSAMLLFHLFPSLIKVVGRRRALATMVSAVSVGLFLLIYWVAQRAVWFHDAAIAWNASFRTVSMAARLDMWGSAVRMFIDAPLFGSGFGNFLFVFNHYHPGHYALNLGPDGTTEEWVDNAHSLFFETLGTTGLVGTVPLLVLLGVLFCVALKRIQHYPTDKWIFIALMTCFIEQLFVINSISKHVLQIGLIAYFTQDIAPIRWPTLGGFLSSKRMAHGLRVIAVGVCLYGIWHLSYAQYDSLHRFNDIRYYGELVKKKVLVEAYFSDPGVYAATPKLLLISDLESTVLSDGQLDVSLYAESLAKLIREEIQRDPKNIKFRVSLGRLYLLFDLPAAQAIFKTVVRDAPTKPHSYYYLGYSQLVAGEPLQAAQSLRRCLSIDSRMKDCERLLALVR